MTPDTTLEPMRMNHICHQPKVMAGQLSWGCGALLFCALFVLASSSSAYTLVSSNALVFVNVDHAAVGTYSTLVYGAQGDRCGLGMSSASIPYASGGGGVVIALSGPNGLQALPFVASTASISSNATYFAYTNVQRVLTPCTDEWNVNGGALTFTHYTPAWNMPDLVTASQTARRRFFLPATWLVFTINNTNNTAEDFYFGLRASGTQQSYMSGAYQGFSFNEAALAVQTGSCDLLSGTNLTAVLSGMTSGFAFHLNVPAGQTKTLTVVVAYYRSTALDARVSGSYYYKSLFSSMDSVIDAAFAELPDAQARCQQLKTAMASVGLNPYRRFLASHALHSYMADTVCLIDPGNRVYWREMEGEYNYINTFDLTVDHAFYDSYMYPWALRNVLDTYSGAINGAGYAFTHPLYNVTNNAVVSTNGFSFHHDMGSGGTSLAPGTDPTGYESTYSYMGQEELQNWILCAGLYWSHSGNDAWLTNNAALLQTCLNSMLLRDDTNALTRDGITTYINYRGPAPEISTYDALDPSLQSPRLNGMTTVKSWAAYVAMQAMFNRIGDTADATICQNAAMACAQSITNAWNTYKSSPGYIPAFLDGSNLSAIIPMVEGLAVPAQMGLSNAVDRIGGPYAAMLQALSNHMNGVLISGRCLDATSGGWKLSSANVNTWQSKVYLCQYVTENVLGITNNNVDGTVDQIHATIEMTEAPYQGWSDQLQSTGSGSPLGSRHYPRGVTSALWWLSPTNNPPYPVVPTTGTNITVSLNGSMLTVSWPTNYVGWILQTNFMDLNNGAAWGDVVGSETNSQMSWPVNDPTIPRGYFRLRY
jgi:hypothetical protein